ncbi:MAG: ammonia-forming cytochrome c nitrite reductase subunit c552 [Bacteroidota bacterium]
MNITELIEKKPWTAWVLFGGTIIIVFLVGWLGASIMERRSEAMMQYQVTKPIAEWEPRNEVWGENYPREYETYKSTKDTTYLSKYGGNKKRDLLEEDPLNVILWAGYAFSREYNQARGHYYAISDIRNTLRTAVPQPATCWSCKSPDVPRIMNKIGPANFYKGHWDSLGHEIVNNIGCQDCHDPKTMNLRITRPALAEAWQRQGKDINNATRQEMRSLVCAQCHVEYYFKGKVEKYLTFPWDKGFSADSMEAYYEQIGHIDFVHTISKTPILKAQHPDYELYRTGIHAERGVSCADCHMPYKNEGGVKFTNHKIASPLENIAGSCQVCHRESEQVLTKNVNDRQDKIMELKHLAEKALVAAHIEAAAAYNAGADSSELVPALKLIRSAQWRWDWVSAANAVGFHSPLEGARVLGTSIQRAEEARRFITQVLIKHNASPIVQMPDLSTKAKAQAFIGLNIPKLINEKNEWKKTVLPTWDAKAKERQGDVKY